MKIAVCDDDQYELGIIRELLDNYEASSNISFTVKYYNSSVELASTAGFEKFDIYFLDIIMPVMNGLALAKEIRTFDKAAPIIFLTSSSEFAVDTAALFPHSGASNKSPAGIPLIPTGPSVYISVTVTASLGRAIKRARQVTVSTGL